MADCRHIFDDVIKQQKHKAMTQATNLQDYQVTVYIKQDGEVLTMTYESYLRNYWSDAGVLYQEIKEVTPDDIEEDISYMVVTRYRVNNQIHSKEEFCTREEAEFAVLKGLEFEMSDANNDTPYCYFSEEEISWDWKVQDSETGTLIDIFDSEEECKEAILEYEARNKEEGNYTPDFYEIVRY